MDPSKPTEPWIDQPTSIPRSRSRSDDPPSEALVGEIIPKGVPIGRRPVDAEPRGRPPSGPGGPTGQTPPVKKGRLRRAFIVMAALAVGLCLGGVAITYVLYDKATTPDRSSPSVVLTQYIDMKFVTRDQAKLKSFECASPNLSEVDGLFADLRAREDRFNITIQVSASDYNVVTNANKSTLDATLKIAVPEENGQLSRSFQQWQFALVDENGWRVCGAHRTG